jgi:hypothetical protein
MLRDWRATRVISDLVDRDRSCFVGIDCPSRSAAVGLDRRSSYGAPRRPGARSGGLGAVSSPFRAAFVLSWMISTSPKNSPCPGADTAGGCPESTSGGNVT